MLAVLISSLIARVPDEPMSQVQCGKSNRIFSGRVSYVYARNVYDYCVLITCDTAADERCEFAGVLSVASVTSELCHPTRRAVMELTDARIDTFDSHICANCAISTARAERQANSRGSYDEAYPVRSKLRDPFVTSLTRGLHADLLDLR